MKRMCILLSVILIMANIITVFGKENGRSNLSSTGSVSPNSVYGYGDDIICLGETFYERPRWEQKEFPEDEIEWEVQYAWEELLRKTASSYKNNEHRDIFTIGHESEWLNSYPFWNFITE